MSFSLAPGRSRYRRVLIGDINRQRRFLRRAIGTRADWRLQRIRLAPPQVGIHWVGPLAIVVSIAVSWWAFTGAAGGGGGAAFGLYIGAVSIMLMAWSFVLAFRSRLLEPFFGGLDSMYRVHRWAGALAVTAMFLHIQTARELASGVPGASQSVADAAVELATTAEVMLYTLVAITLLRWFPYRWWRWTHKILGIPFVFACWHWYTAKKPYANGSGWGWWFGSVMVIGFVAYLARVVGRDVIAPGLRYRITAATATGAILEVAMEPTKRGLAYRAGQFAVIKVQAPGLREPHMFSIASSRHDAGLRFLIRDLGDWTERMHRSDLVGVPVVVEGPYGEFDPVGDSAGSTVWVAGGVGVTPFLSAAQDLAPTGQAPPPTLLYCVHDSTDLMGIDILRAADAQGRLTLVICNSTEGTRFSEATLQDRFGEHGLVNARVAVCGPASLVHTVTAAARSLGATHVEREDFDIRQGFGPDLSREFDRLWRQARDTKVS